jgi:hypothetical protein
MQLEECNARSFPSGRVPLRNSEDKLSIKTYSRYPLWNRNQNTTPNLNCINSKTIRALVKSLTQKPSSHVSTPPNIHQGALASLWRGSRPSKCRWNRNRIWSVEALLATRATAARSKSVCTGRTVSLRGQEILKMTQANWYPYNSTHRFDVLIQWAFWSKCWLN